MIQPLFDKILIKMKKEEKTQSGIILSSVEKEKNQIAEIIEVGKGGFIDNQKIEIVVKKGDIVLINKYSGTEINYLGDDYLIIKQDDILAIIE